MRITQEADYALRIVCLLARQNDILGAGTIAAQSQVTPRFTLKILHKLVVEKLVCSFKGNSGGYKLAVPASGITLRRVIEVIDGPFAISRCVSEGKCTSEDKESRACVLHHIFSAVNGKMAALLDSVSIEDVVENNEKVTALLSSVDHIPT